jgi:hypothetical protein
VTWKVWIIPVVIVALSFAGFMGAKRISVPTLTFIFDKEFRGETATAKLTVDGVRCYGTADALREHIAGLSGLVSMVAYGGRHRVDLRYDPRRVAPDQITESIERPVSTPQGPTAFFKVVGVDVK